GFPVKIDLNHTARLQKAQQILKRRFRIRKMVQHADRVDEIKTLQLERRIVQISLHYVNVARLSISTRDLHRWSKIYGPSFSAVLRRVIRKPPVAATGVENLLSRKEVSRVGPHVFKKLAFPFFVHLRKLVPFITKTVRRVGLRFFSRCDGAF